MSDRQFLTVTLAAAATMLVGLFLMGLDAGIWYVVVPAAGACNAAFAAGCGWERRGR